MATCEACIAGQTNGAAARVAFVVAAMEVGFLFEVIEDPLSALETRTELAVEQGLPPSFSKRKVAHEFDLYPPLIRISQYRNTAQTIGTI